MAEMWYPDSELFEPMHWRSPRRVLVCPSMGLFHESIPFPLIDKAIAVMVLSPGHMFYTVITHIGRAMEYFHDYPSISRDGTIMSELCSNRNLLWEALKQFGGSLADSEIVAELERSPRIPPANMLLLGKIYLDKLCSARADELADAVG